jgi:ubiquinone/menaquinone biosynthesis C-methylase UbiE
MDEGRVGQVVERLAIERSHYVLDLGCGNGHHSRLIIGMGIRQLIDLDIALADLRKLAFQSRVHSPYPYTMVCSFVCGDALHLPFSDNSFDRVICSLVFYLLPLQQALVELHRVVKPGGMAYLRVPMLSWGRVVRALRELSLYSACQLFNGFYYASIGVQFRNPFLRHDRWACYIPRGRYEQAILKAGFQIERLEIDYPNPGILSIDTWVRKA